MDSTTIIIIGIVILFLILCLTIIVLVIYSGLLHNIKIIHGKPPLTSLSFMYKVGSGPYQNSTDIFAEASAIAPNLYSIGVYFDDPCKEKNLRWLAGTVLEDDTDESIKKKFEENGFKNCLIGEIKNCVWTTFPFTFTFSIPIAIYRVYPALISYIKSKKLEAHPMVEIYTKDSIHFLAITENQKKFYIPDIVSTGNTVVENNFDDKLITHNNEDEHQYNQHFINEDAVNEYLIEDLVVLNSENRSSDFLINDVLCENEKSESVDMVENLKATIKLSQNKTIEVKDTNFSLLEDGTKCFDKDYLNDECSDSPMISI